MYYLSVFGENGKKFATFEINTPELAQLKRFLQNNKSPT